VSDSRMTVERLTRFNEAWARGDVDELMTYLTDDCVYSASVGPEPGQTFTGRDEVRRGIERMLAHDAAGEGHTGRVWVAGDVGAAEWSYVFSDADGGEREVKGCDLFQFRGDLIAVKDAYRKTSEQ
jgi:ketosteroid isomerase-like protein